MKVIHLLKIATYFFISIIIVQSASLFPSSVNDLQPTLSIYDVVVNEGAGIARSLVSLSNPSSFPVTVNYSTADGTATAGRDYVAISGFLPFSPGETAKQISVPILDDLIYERYETFSLNLSNPTNATISDSQGIGTIVDNDQQPTLSIDDVTVNEGAGIATFTVTLSNPSSFPVTVNYDIADGTATAGSDYIAISGTLTFSPGETTKTISVPILEDLIYEGYETFSLNLSNPTNTTISDDQGIGTIVDNAQASDTGPDTKVGDIQSVSRFDRVGNITSYGVGTYACNYGDERVDWFANTNRHPVIFSNMYRLKDGRFEQIGMSWGVHEFFAVSWNFCQLQCTDPTDGTQLGVGCSSPISAFLAGVQTNLGKRSEINASTGYFPYPPSSTGIPPGNSIDRRLQIQDSYLVPSLNTDALYFVEGHYISPSDAEAGNNHNDASYRQVAVTETSTNVYDIVVQSSTQREQQALRAWQDIDPSVIETDIQTNEGLFILSAKETDLGNGLWHYEYALQNFNSDRSAGSFSIPLPPCAIIQNIGFHDVDYHSGEDYDLSDWAATVTDSSITWTTESYADNPNANALRFGTVYNFWFDIYAPPDTTEATISLFKPGTPNTVNAVTVGPANDSSSNQPVANAGGPYMVNEGVIFILDGLASCGNIVSYEWDLDNDGEYDDATGVTTTLFFNDDGVYTVRLKVTDSYDVSDIETTTVTVNDLGPTAELIGDTTLDEGQAGNYDASGSTSSPDVIFSYEWDWDYDGATFNPSGDTGAIQSHTWLDNGNYTVAVRVTDDDGSTDIDTLGVTVNDLAPPTAPTPFFCDGEAYTVRSNPGKLYRIDQNVTPFIFIQIGSVLKGPFGVGGSLINIQVNNIGYRVVDNMLYGIALASPFLPNFNYGLVKIDSDGNVFLVHTSPEISNIPKRFLAGDIDPNTDKMYLNTYPTTSPMYIVDLNTLTVTTKALSLTYNVNVADWAVNPLDGKLYGADGLCNPYAQIYQLDPMTGIITNLGGPVGQFGPLPCSNSGDAQHYGGAWFNAQGELFIYRDNDYIYKIDISQSPPIVIDVQQGGAGSSQFNDAAVCSIDQGNILFTEVFYDTPGIDSEEEWIELYNPSSFDMNIAGWKIVDNNGTGWTYFFPAGTSIAPDTYLTVAMNSAGFNALYGYEADLYGSLPFLNNAGDTLILYDSFNNEVDAVAWEGGASAGSPDGWGSTSDPWASTGSTIVRSDPSMDTDAYNDWTTAANNGNPQTQLISEPDTTPPEPDVFPLPDVTGECSAEIVTVPTATDDQAGSIDGTTTDPIIYSEQGTYTVIWTYTDESENTATQTQTVIVQDVTSPVPVEETLPTVAGECSVEIASVPSATDNCTGSIVGTTSDPLSYTEQGTYTLTWTYDDGNGNTSTQTQTVIVQDVTSPVPVEETLPIVTGECSVEIAVVPSATDNCAGSIVGTTSDPRIYTEQGTFTLTWTYDDGNGNTSSQTQTITVEDITPPQIHLSDPTCVEIKKWKLANMLTVRASDNCSPDVEFIIDKVEIFNRGGRRVWGRGVYSVNGSDIYVYPKGRGWSVRVTVTAADTNGNMKTEQISKSLLRCNRMSEQMARLLRWLYTLLWKFHSCW